MEDRLILVDIDDNPIGEAGKLEAHQKSLLHRAFSVFLYKDGKMLIQKRADDKYHSGGLIANTCCSHPRVDEKLEDAVKRRLMEEAGVECPVKHLTSFIYRERFEELCEYEYDHIFVGEYDGEYVCNFEEAQEMYYEDENRSFDTVINRDIKVTDKDIKKLCADMKISVSRARK